MKYGRGIALLQKAVGDPRPLGHGGELAHTIGVTAAWPTKVT